ncbi:MAG: hypothetical protein LBK99_09780 [Opitutaceae bacterium]|nr:hypothetical protein [Opitutaceae bacterium]
MTENRETGGLGGGGGGRGKTLVLGFLTVDPESPQVASASSGSPETTVATPALVASAWHASAWRTGLTGVWLAGAAMLAGAAVVGRVRLWHLCRRRGEQVCDARVAALGGRIAAGEGIRRTVRFRMARDCRVAMTWGIWRPVVMLPDGARGWSEERLSLVLRHELAHVKRRDCLARLCCQVAYALYWPNPLVWAGARRARLAQEQACDNRVLAAGVPVEAYAMELVAAARESGGRRFGAVVAMAERSTLETRVQGIMSEGRDRRPVRRSMAALTSLAALVVLAGCSAVVVRDGPGPSASGEPSAFAAGETVMDSTVAARPAADRPPAVPVVMKACFVEIREMPSGSDALDALLDGRLLPPPGGVIGVLPQEQTASVFAAPHTLRRMEIMTTPKVTVAAGHPAIMQVGQDLHYPIRWGKVSGEKGVDPGEWEFAGVLVGVELRVRPQIHADGSLQLEATPTHRVFEGFVEVASPASALDKIGPVLTPDEVESFSRRPERDSSLIPVFLVKTLTVDVRIVPGQTVVLRCVGKKRILGSFGEIGASADPLADPAADPAGEPAVSLVLITADIVSPSAGPAGGPDKKSRL